MHHLSKASFVIWIFFLFLIVYYSFGLEKTSNEVQFSPEENLVNVVEEVDSKTDQIQNSSWILNGGSWMNYQNLAYWDHMPLTYNLLECPNEYEINRIRNAFQLVQNETDNAVRFLEVNGSSDIISLCHREYKEGETEGMFESGDAEIKVSGDLIVSGTLNFNSVREGYYPGGCVDYPAVEIHEIIHVLGLGHTSRNISIMNSVGNGCRAKLDAEIIDVLKQIYR